MAVRADARGFPACRRVGGDDGDQSLTAPGKGCRRPSAQMEPRMCELAHFATDFIRRSNAAKHISDRSLEAAAVERVMAIA